MPYNVLYLTVKWAYPVTVVGWSAAGAAAGLAGTFVTLFGLRALAASALTGAFFMWLVGWLADAGGFALPLVLVGILPVVSLIGIGNAVRLIARQHEAPLPSSRPAGGL